MRAKYAMDMNEIKTRKQQENIGISTFLLDGVQGEAKKWRKI